jgi:hypothetical protein
VVKLGMRMQYTTLCTPCIAFVLVAHTCMLAIGHAKQGHMEPPEPAPVEGADYE